MRKEEQKLWDTMRANKPGGTWLHRIENIVGEGTPDVLVNGRVWVELKAPIRPRLSTSKVLGSKGLNQQQINWHRLATQHNAKSYVLVRCDRHSFLIPGTFAEDINYWNWIQLDSHSLANHWQGIYEVLSS